jgi:hypothetical protein
MNKYALYTVKIFLFIGLFGTIIFVFLYAISNSRFFLYAVSLKDIALYIFIISEFSLFFFGKFYINKKRFVLIGIFCLFLGMTFISILQTRGNFLDVIYICRRYFTPLIVILTFSSINIRISILNTYIKKVSYFLLFFGLFEYFLCNIEFWDTIIKLPDYWAASGDRWARESVAVSGRFFSWDLAFLTGEATRRMVSSFAEPTNFASFLVSIYIIFKEKIKENKIILISVIVCAVLTISKAAILVIFIIMPFIKFFKYLFPKFKYSNIYLIMFIAMYLVSGIFHAFGLSSGPFSHINGYYTGINNIIHGHFGGYGLGKAGNISDNSVDGVGVESGMGGMLAQMGIGGIIYVFFFYILLRYLECSEKINRAPIMLIIAWGFISIFSESSFGISGNILFWLYPAIYLHKMVMSHKPEYGTRDEIPMSPFGNGRTV